MQPRPDSDPDFEGEDWEHPSAEFPSFQEGRRELLAGWLTPDHWNPVPVPRPKIAANLGDLSWPERSSEAICFTLLSVEHWLSRSGFLREWLRLNLWLAVILTLTAVLLVPPLTALLAGAAEWTSLGGSVVDNIHAAVLKLPPIVLAIASVLLAAAILQRHWNQRRRGGRFREDPYEGYR